MRHFRHRFAVETLLGWYRNGEQVVRRMPVLSTYLGHGNVTNTYWYLTNTFLNNTPFPAVGRRTRHARHLRSAYPPVQYKVVIYNKYNNFCFVRRSIQ
jgi:hypothetical protein